MSYVKKRASGLFFLSRGSEIERYRDDKEDEVREPCGGEGRHDIIDRESGTDGREEYISGRKDNTYTEVLTHTSSYFAARHSNAEQGHDKCSDG